MALTINDYLNHMKTSRQFTYLCKVELLDKNEHIVSNGVFTGRIKSGSLNVKKNNGTRRTCSLTLLNVDGYVNPSPDILWVNQKFALYLGVRINGEDFFIKQGIFIADNPTMTVDGAMSMLNITGNDKWSLLDGTLAGVLDGTYYVPVGSAPNAVVSSLLTLDNLDDPKPLIADATITTTPYELYVDIGGSYADVVSEISDMLSRNRYYDYNGNLNIKDEIDDDLKPSLWSFNTRSNYLYMGGTQTFDYQNAYNAVIVIGNNINGEIFSALVENRNNASPLSIDKIGYKLKPIIFDTNIYTDELALIRCNYELKLASRLASSVNFNCHPLFHLYPDGICIVTDSRLNLQNERLLINGYSINFGDNTTMAIDATRTQELLFEFN